MDEDNYLLQFRILHHDDFFEHLQTKRLVIDDALNFPISSFERSYRYRDKGYKLCRESKNKLLKCINELTVPQFVADWIEGRKRRYTLASLFTLRYMPEDVCRWIAFYTVTLINVELVKDDEGRLFFHGDMKHNNKLTRQEIESVNPRLMELAEEVE